MTNTVFFARNDWTAISQEKKNQHMKKIGVDTVLRYIVNLGIQIRWTNILKKNCYVIFFTIKNSYVYVTRCTSFIQMHLIDGIYYLLFVRQECDKNFLDINYLL